MEQLFQGRFRCCVRRDFDVATVSGRFAQGRRTGERLEPKLERRVREARTQEPFLEEKTNQSGKSNGFQFFFFLSSSSRRVFLFFSFFYKSLRAATKRADNINVSAFACSYNK